MSAGKNVVDSFREAVQDLLVPELKAIKVSVESLHGEIGYLRSEMKAHLDSLRTEMRLRDERMEQLIRSGDEKLEQLVRMGDEKNEQATRALADKLDFAIDVRERLATLEARQPRQ